VRVAKKSAGIILRRDLHHDLLFYVSYFGTDSKH